MATIIKFNTSSGSIQHMHQVEICRIHLENYKNYVDGKHPGTNIAKKTLIRNNFDELRLLIDNLLSQYDENTVILALRSLKMYKYCAKYLKTA